MRFRRTVKIAPGVRLNFSGSGVSTTFGGRGFSHTIGKRGSSTTLGLPGTGLSQTFRHGRTVKPSPPPALASNTSARNTLSLSLLDRLFKSRSQKTFIRALAALKDGDHNAARIQLANADDHPDSSFLSGYCALKQSLPDVALHHFERSMMNTARLGERFRALGANVNVQLQVTDELSVGVEADKLGLGLIVVEACQMTGDLDKAIKYASALSREFPRSRAASISFAEALLSADSSSSELAEAAIIALAAIENDDQTGTIAALYRSRLLKRQGAGNAAVETLTAALRRKKDRDPHILRRLRYERGKLHEEFGKAAMARKDFESVYAEDPRFEDVAQRLGL